MQTGLETRLDRLFNRQGDGRAVCIAADHGYMSDVTSNVIELRTITEAVIKGGADGILTSPGQAMRMAPLFQGRDGPALILRADWMNSPRLGGDTQHECRPPTISLPPKNPDRRAGPGSGRNRHHYLSFRGLQR